MKYGEYGCRDHREHSTIVSVSIIAQPQSPKETTRYEVHAIAVAKME